MMKTTPCAGCGKPMLWGETDEGKHIPLDPSAPVYQIVSVSEDGKAFIRRLPQRYELGADACTMVSHFKTCPKASDFSRGKRK